MANEYNNTEVSKRIKQLLASINESEYGLAKILKITPSSISQAMRGVNNWSTANLIGISKYFSVSLDWLVWGREFKETEALTKIRNELLEARTKYEKLRADYEVLKKSFQIYLGKKPEEN